MGWERATTTPGELYAAFGLPLLLAIVVSVVMSLCGCGTPVDQSAKPADTIRPLARLSGGYGLFAVRDVETGATVYFIDCKDGGVAVLPADAHRKEKP